jgi:hypothetical protein
MTALNASTEDEAEELEPLHTRNYHVEAFRRNPHEFLVRGRVIDTKPPGLYSEADPEPFELHHMVVELTVSFPDLVITRSDVTFNTFPQEACPLIAQRYGELAGLSIARGFTHAVRERLGGPRGCSHTTALLQAMAPVAVQCHWSMVALARRDAATAGLSPTPTGGDREASARLSLNSCHVWDEHGDFYRSIVEGTRSAPVVMIPLRRRLIELGIDPEAWALDHPGG